MKKIITILLLGVLPSCATMQTVSFTETEYVNKVFEDAPGTKDQLYLKANRWMVTVFNNAESVIQHSDKEEGVIIGKYLMNGEISTGMYGVVNDSRVYAIIDIKVKENKAKIEIRPQGSWQFDSSGLTIFDYSKEKAIEEMNSLADSFHKSLLRQETEF